MIKTRGDYDKLMHLLQSGPVQQTHVFDEKNRPTEIAQLHGYLYAAEWIDHGNGLKKWWKPIDRDALPIQPPSAPAHTPHTAAFAAQHAPSTQAMLQPPDFNMPEKALWADVTFDASHDALPNQQDDGARTNLHAGQTTQFQRPARSTPGKLLVENAGIKKPLAGRSLLKSTNIPPNSLFLPLLKAGYTQAEIDNIGATKMSRDQLSAFLTHAPALVAAGYDKAKLIKVACQAGAVEALPALIIYHPQLVAVGFSPEHIIDAANKERGALALPALVKYGAQLQALGLTQKQIVKAASHHGAEKALAAILEQAPKLEAQGIGLADVIEVAGKSGAAQILVALRIHGPALEAAGYSRQNVIKVANNRGASQTLLALRTHSAALLSAGLSRDSIVAMASTPSASKKFLMAVTFVTQTQRPPVPLEAIVAKAADVSVSPARFSVWLKER
jgi:hypothetical protein